LVVENHQSPRASDQENQNNTAFTQFKAQCCDKSTREARLLLERTMIATQPIIISWLMCASDYPDYSMAGGDWRFTGRLDDSWFVSPLTLMESLTDALVQRASSPLRRQSRFRFLIRCTYQLLHPESCSKRHALDPMVSRIVSRFDSVTSIVSAGRVPSGHRALLRDHPQRDTLLEGMTNHLGSRT
jgi:hypothetical protein